MHSTDSRPLDDEDLAPDLDLDAPDIDDLSQADLEDLLAAVDDPGEMDGSPVGGPRVLYIDPDDDLAALLDRVEETGSPAIIVLPDGARAVRGMVAARLLKRRADAAGIVVAAVVTDKTTVAQFSGVGIPCAATVGEARGKLAGPRKPAPPGPQIPAGRRVYQPPVVDALEEDDGPLDRTAPSAIDEDEEPVVVTAVDEQGQPIARPAQLLTTRISAPSRSVNGQGRRRWPYAVLAALLTLLLAFGTWVVLFPAATITITYAVGRFDRTYVVPLGTNAPGAIALHHTELTDTASAVVTGTGTRLVPDGHATGTVTFANQADGYVVVPAGTVVVAQGGSRYATLADASVPAAVHSFSGTTNGQQSVAVRAINGGISANVGQGTITTIEGRLAGVLLVINYAPLTGGTMRTEYNLTAADIATATANLRQRLANQETATLNQRFALSPIRLMGPIRVSAPRVVPYTANGRVYARVSLTARATMAYVHAQDVRQRADALRDRDLAGRNQQITAGSESVTLSTQGKGAMLTITLHVQGRTTPTIDVANLRAMLVGRSVADARQLLDASAANGGWRYTISTTPDLARRLPQATGLINIQVIRQG